MSGIALVGNLMSYFRVKLKTESVIFTLLIVKIKVMHKQIRRLSI
jgi:hypothetical protein